MTSQTPNLKVRLTRLAKALPYVALPAEGYTFQCAPLNEFGVSYTHAHTEYATISDGQFSRPLGRNLASVAFDTIIVARDADGDLPAFAHNVAGTVEELSETLRDICNEGLPFHLTVTAPGSTAPNAGGVLATMPATLRSVKVVDKEGEVDAQYVTVEFMEYRDPKNPDPKTDTTIPHKTPGSIRMRYDKNHHDWAWIHVTGSDGKRHPHGGAHVKITRPITVRSLAINFYGRGYAKKGAAAILAANSKVLGKKWHTTSLLQHHKKAQGKHGLLLRIPKPS